ncbi:MAG: aspartate/glutamate racemase family protein [Lautropia sp.]
MHAHSISMGPIEDCFRSMWPQASVFQVLDSSLYADLGAAGGLTDALAQRCHALARYCVGAGADAVVFTGSAFSPAVDAAQAEHAVPILKPNEALYDEIGRFEGPVALLTTFEPTLTLMQRELQEHSLRVDRALDVRPHMVEHAFDAALDLRQDEHDARVVDAATRYADCSAIAFVQVSMTRAAPRVRDAVTIPVLTSPECTVRRLMRMFDAART